VLRAIKVSVRPKFQRFDRESDNNEWWQRAELGISRRSAEIFPAAFVGQGDAEVGNFIDSLGIVPLAPKSNSRS